MPAKGAADWARDLLDHLPDAFLLHSAGEIIFVNRRGLELLGYERAEELIGRSPLHVVHPDEHPLVLARMARMAAGSDAEPLVEERLLRRDATVLNADVRVARVRLGDQVVTMALARDASERRRLQERGALADRMAAVGRLAAGVAHGINNPLAYVLANAGYALEELGRMPSPSGDRPAVADDVMRALRQIVEGSRRIQALVASLTMFARSEEPATAVVDVQKVLEAAIALTSYEIRRRARLVTEFGETPRVRAGESRLAHAFLNLLVHAAHALGAEDDEDHEIRVRTATDALGRAVVEIHDNGEGLSPEVVGSVFDPFFTTCPEDLGVGLGLSIAYEIVASLGGTIVAESDLGRGSVFRVTLPAAAEAAASEKRQDAGSDAAAIPGRPA